VIPAGPEAGRSRPAHRVETLRWELRYPSARVALRGSAMQDRLARFLRSEGLRHIAACFDRHDATGLVWQIDRLELDLGRLSPRQDEHQWAARLDEALDLALLRARQRTPAQGLASARLHAIHQFLFYLLNGHLPWGISLPGRHAVANWLARLAREHGPRLWTALQGHPERDAMLARLAQISPHHGLHALLAGRDALLANALQALDDGYLMPLQAHGWLGAHQRQQLQQALRVAGLRASWGARGSALGAGRRPSLLEALRRALAEHLGPAWATRLAAVPAANVPASAGDLFRELIALPSLQPEAAARGEMPDADHPTRTWEVGLQELRMALSRTRPHSAALSARVAVLLDRLAASHPSALRNCLLQWAGERRQRRQWSQCLAPGNLGTLLAAMCPAGTAGPAHAAPHAPQWTDSLRQTALRLQRDAPADRRPRLGRLQALLMEACLQRLAEGHRLPDSHSAWQALWHEAWAQWLGEDEAQARPRPTPLVPEPAAEVDHSPSNLRREPLRGQELPAAPGAPPRAGLDAALRGLERQCREGRWAWPERRRLARLLETDSACERWLQLFDESSRWQMLRAQFGAAARRLQERAGRLQRWLAGALHEPLARVQEHWRRLCRYLFVQGLSPDRAALRGHYQAQSAPAAKVAPTRLVEALAPIWVADAGQVLLMAYAERLFKQQGLLDQGRFIDSTAQARAVQCLQTLCHGEGPVDEAQTVLSRLLCGVSPTELLPAVDPLPPDSVALLEQLLQAVITHWKAVGHTSVAGLRESFLQREGRLQRDRIPADEPPRWHLRVQARGFDVLLDRLPWSFQTIRLPWMQGALHVEWR
jgi:hypothetical protein